MSDDLLDERLGRPAELAARAADEYRRSTWVARHPFWVFALLPLPAAVLLSVACELLLVLVWTWERSLFANPSGEVPRWITLVSAYGLSWFVGIVPSVLLAAYFSRLYLRHRVSQRWFMVAAAQVLLFAGSLLSVLLDGNEPGQKLYMLEYAWLPRPTSEGWGLPLLQWIGWMQLIQVLATVAVGWSILRAGLRGRKLVDVAGVAR